MYVGACCKPYSASLWMLTLSISSGPALHMGVDYLILMAHTLSNRRGKKVPIWALGNPIYSFKTALFSGRLLFALIQVCRILMETSNIFCSTWFSAAPQASQPLGQNAIVPRETTGTFLRPVLGPLFGPTTGNNRNFFPAVSCVFCETVSKNWSWLESLWGWFWVPGWGLFGDDLEYLLGWFWGPKWLGPWGFGARIWIAAEKIKLIGHCLVWK